MTSYKQKLGRKKKVKEEKSVYVIVQDGDNIGTIKNIKDFRNLPMYSYWAESIKIYKNGRLIKSIKN